jgi:hypothetical protein
LRLLGHLVVIGKLGQVKGQHKWFPDSIFTDNSTGHVWKYRQPLEDEITEAKLYAREHNLPVTSTCQKYVGTDKRNELVIIQEGDSLADHCQALICAIRDTLIIQQEVAVRQKNIGSPIIARNNQIALLFFMSSHYVADGSVNSYVNE